MAFLEAVLPAGLLDRGKLLLAERRHSVMLGAAAATIAAVVVAGLWAVGGDSGYGVLFAGLAPDEGGRAIDELQKLNLPFRVADGGREILVPNSEIGRTRLTLAARGVPKKSNDAWSLFDNASLGVSPFAEQARYLRGLEDSLSKTVGDINGVAAAKVTLAVPQRTAFLETQPKPTASVMLRLSPGVSLSRAQLDGIVHLVASGVPGLEPAGVSIVDENGRILTRDDANQSAQIPEQLSVVRDIDQRYQMLIEGLLAPAVGRENLRVIVDADVDFSQAKRSSVIYGQGHTLSQDQSSREQSSDAQPTGVPGALSNQPPNAPNVPLTVRPGNDQNPRPAAPVNKDSHAVVNYDIDKTIEMTEGMPWHVNAISAAILVNNHTGAPLPQEKIQSIKSLVQSAIGSGAKREVTVIDLPFAGEGAAATPAEWWRQNWVRDAAENALLALAGLLTLVGVVFPALRWSRNRTLTAARPAQAPRAAEPAKSDAAPQAQAAGKFNPITGPTSGQTIVEPDIAAVRRIAANDPGATAQVIKEWLAHAGRTKQSS